MGFLRKLIDRIQGWLEGKFPAWAHRRHIQIWNRKWKNPEFNPFWKTEEPQKELLEAVRTGWFTQTERVIDVGCGNGEVSRWLAQEGYTVLGIDYSSSAIENCRRISAGQANAPAFEVADLCSPDLSLEPVGNLIDRGCFHRIADQFLPLFAQNIAHLTRAGGHFLLLSGTFQHSKFTHYRGARSEEQLREHVEKIFGDYFAIDRAESAIINASGGQEAMPAVAFWMVRKPRVAT